jgi:plasmid stabilization system protein ParE
MRIRVIKTARRDLDAIYDYWAERAGPDIAQSLIYSITDLFAMIAEFPYAGRTCDEIAPGVRVFPTDKYLIYYRKERSVIKILHIVHGARDQARAFSNN